LGENNRNVGTFGDIGTFSFYSSHQLSGLGGNGALCTNNDEIASQCRSMRDWGKVDMNEGYHTTAMTTVVDGVKYDKQYTYQTIGYNMRASDVACAYTREQLKKLDKYFITFGINFSGC